MGRSLPRARATLPPDAAAGTVVPLDEGVARHLVTVRRLQTGDAVELFDGAGRQAEATLVVAQSVTATLVETPTSSTLPPLVVCSAVPKGQRADWLAEKLGELGVSTWVPLKTARSVVDPGDNKLDRWRRLADAAATQSRSPTTMTVESTHSLADALAAVGSGIVMATERPGDALHAGAGGVFYIGPEGGWSDGELEAFDAAGCTFATLGPTILRIETAAILAAGIVRSG